MSIPPDAAAVRRQLERMLASPVFARSERMCRFLSVVVEESLTDPRANLKEPVLALKVFDRGADYDPAQDPVVRVEARRLRAKLEEYYSRLGVSDPIVIRLPKGSYRPAFEVAAKTNEIAGRRLRRPTLALVAASVLTCVLAAAVVLTAIYPASSASVAVLPFLDLSPERNLGYFCDGLAEQLIFVLSRIDGLHVPGRTSSFVFRESGNLAGIGANLHVDHVLEGSVRVSGERMRITTQLIEIKSGYPLWSAEYERKLEDIFALQDEISRAVGNALQIRVGRRRAATSTENPEALRMYLQGREQWYRNSFVRAAELFDSAIRRDPGYATAYAWLARAYVRMDEDSDTSRKAEASARRALEIDENLVEAMMVLATIRVREWDWPGAEQWFRRAMKADAKFAEAHGEYAIGYLAPRGRIAEALTESAISLQLAPAAPFENIRHGVLLTDARRFSEAESQLRRALAVAPEHARRHLGKLYLAMGRNSEALPLFEGEPLWQCITLLRQGRDAHCAPSDRTDAYGALYWDALGERNKAFDVLEKAYATRAVALTTLVNPVWDPLRSDRRFRSLLARMGLAVD